MNLLRTNASAWCMIAAGMLILLLGVPANAQETSFMMDFNGATGDPEGGVDLVSESGSTTRGDVWSPDVGLPGVRARFNTYADLDAGENQWGNVTSLVFDTAMNSGASGEEGDHALSLTVGEGSRAFNANLFLASVGLELDQENPLDALVSVDFKAPAGEKVCVRVETGRWDNFGPLHTLGARYMYIKATGEWQTFSYVLRDGDTDPSLKFIDVGPGRLARVIVQWVNPQQPGTILVDNLRLDHIQYTVE